MSDPGPKLPRNARLAELTRAASQRHATPVTLKLEAVQRERVRRDRLSWFSLVGLAGVAAALMSLWLAPPQPEAGGDSPGAHAAVIENAGRSPAGLSASSGTGEPSVAAPEKAGRLAAASPPLVAFEVLEGPEPGRVSEGEVHLEDGAYWVRVEVEGGPLHIVAEDFESRVLVVEHGELTVDLRGGSPVVVLHSGLAAWRNVAQPDEAPVSLLVKKAQGVEVAVAPAVAERPATQSARQLARRAENAMAAGRPKAAIDALEKLLSHHRSSSHARSAILDLGRLHRRQGNDDKARCAYQLYLERWPHGSLRPEIERKLVKLGDGRCRGLEPRP